MEGLREKHLPDVKSEAKDWDLDWRVIDALIHIESSWNPVAMRYERNFTYFTSPERYAKQNRITLDTEKVLQKCSFGLMQIMGGTARFLNYIGPLVGLFDPETNIHLGCKFFAQLAHEYTNVNDQIAAYNAGSVKRLANGQYFNQAYVDKVLAVLKTL